MSDYAGIFGEENQRRAPCPRCKESRRVDTLFAKIDRWDIPGPDISGLDEYYVFQCRGCEAIFFAKSSGHSEDYDYEIDPSTGQEEKVYNFNKSYFPSIQSRPAPTWAHFKLAVVDEILHDLLHSIYKCLQNDMPVFAAIGIRTTLDRMSEILGINPELPFSDKLEALRKDGYISGTQKGFLSILIDAGSAAAHRGWKPSDEHLSTMVDILEGLIRDHFILREEVKKLKESIPPRD